MVRTEAKQIGTKMNKIYKIQQMLFPDGSTQMIPDMEEFFITKSHPNTYLICTKQDSEVSFYITKEKINAVTLGPLMTENCLWQELSVFVIANSPQNAVRKAADVLVEYYEGHIEMVQQWMEDMLEYLNGAKEEMEFEECDLAW